jgi:tetratricopeptide (TPR) repeat protein
MPDKKTHPPLSIVSLLYSPFSRKWNPFSVEHCYQGIAFLLLTATITSPARLDAKTASEVFEQASRSVVVVYNLDDKDNRQQFASGVVMPDGEVATNHHIIEKAARLAVIFNGKAFAAKARHYNPENDICLLDVPDLKAPKALIGDTNQLKVGARVYAIGSPSGLELTLSDGIVSGFREVKGGHYIQNTAPISSGSSGGGLFDEEGLLVGLPTFYLSEGQQLNFALPIEWVLEESMRQNTHATFHEDQETWLNKIIVLEQKKDWPCMLQECQLRLKARPNDSEAWYHSGIANSRTGDMRNAIADFRKAVSINPDFSAAWCELGIAYGLSGKEIEAVEAFRKATRIKPDNTDAWANLGEAYSRSGQTDKAVEAYNQALLINPGNVHAFFNLGRLYASANNQEKVMELYRKLKTIDPIISKKFLQKYILPR